MNRKQHKSIMNWVARHIGRAAAKSQFGKRSDFTRFNGAFIHEPSATLAKA